MAAPQIPNLNTLRRGQGRSLGRGRGGPSSSSSHEEEKAAKDDIVQQTDQDASVSRLSAVDVGYLHDLFARQFVSGPSQRRFPIINRGTYVRTKAIDNLVHRFLSPSSSSPRKQIISLGAGSDTRFFRLQTCSPSLPPFVYHEFDFPTNTALKITTITTSLDLLSLIPGYNSDSVTASAKGISLSTPTYYIHPLDLRALSSSLDPPKSLKTIDATLPTLIISECCLIYLPPHLADNTVTYFTQTLFPPTTPLGLILYEPINPHSAFGKVMARNLATRGIVLQTLYKYESLEAQRARLKGYGFTAGQEAKTVDEVWEMGVGREEKERVAGLEMVDEVEEWRLLAGHYCVAWGWRDGDGDEEGKGKRIWEGWRERGCEWDGDGVVVT
ncbi:MAG: hypothetical protein Q9169_001717 [Polycauliona sp. 2 TL-2023]